MFTDEQIKVLVALDEALSDAKKCGALRELIDRDESGGRAVKRSFDILVGAIGESGYID